MDIPDNFRHAENGYSYELYDLIYEKPRLFRQIFDAAINRLTDFEQEDYKTEQRERELREITDIQYEVMNSLSVQAASRLPVFDRELMRIRNELYWSGAQLDSMVETVFWQDIYDPFVSFARRKGRLSMSAILNTTYDELKEDGLSPGFMAKIAGVLSEWAEELLNPDLSAFDEASQNDEASDETDSNIANEVLSFFFSAEGKDDHE